MIKKTKEFMTNRERAFFSAVIAIIIIIGGILSFFTYFVIQKSYYKSAVNHEIELLGIIESLGSQLIDGRLFELKTDAQDAAWELQEVLVSGSSKEREEALSSLDPKEYQLGWCYQTNENIFYGSDVYTDYIAQLDLSKIWDGESVLFAPDFDAQGNYILVIAVPVWEDMYEQNVAGVLIQQLDGYCLSQWLGELFLPLDLGTAYMIDENGRNIATASEENYDWITTRYNAQNLVKSSDDESTKSVAMLEKYALDGKSGVGTYVWENSTNYVAYGPLQRTNWAFFVGFYGDKFQQYTHDIASVSGRAAGIMLVAFTLFLGTILAILMKNLQKERRYNELLTKQKEEIEQQALSIAFSEERFRIAMQRSRDIILEYQLETKEVICFYGGKEIKGGRVGEDTLRHRIIEDCHIDEDSFERFEEVMRAISKGLTKAECVVTGTYEGNRKWYNLRLATIPDLGQTATRAVGVLRDITSEREAELDSLTRLFNKAAITENIKAFMKDNQPETSSSFIIIDVDYFKTINDKYGHPVGDKVLCAIADYLQEDFPLPYLTGRFGGDEFCVYCPSNANADDLKDRLNRLSSQVKKIQGNGEELSISLSMGVVLFHGKAQFEQIYRKADEMLYHVKKAGRDGYRIFEINLSAKKPPE